MNVVWFCLDTLRADHLGAYGYFRKTSPMMDQLAEEGVLFPQSRANAVATGPAFTSMFTGRYAINNEWHLTPHDVPDVINFPDAQPVFTETIWDHGGLTTAAFDNLFNFRSRMKQFVRGFEFYINVTRTSRPVHHHVLGGAVNERLLPWIREHKSERLFLFVHYWDPHTPYNQPDEFARPFKHERGRLDDLEVREAAAGYRYVPGWGTIEQIPGAEGPADWKPAPGSPARHPTAIDTYDGEILYTDRLIRQVIGQLDACGILERTAIVINADHGEQLNQHLNLWGHAGLHDANVFTPLILWRPGLLPGGARPAGYVHHIDVGPTILDILGIEPNYPMDGVSLLPLIRGEAAPRDHCFAETLGMRAVVRDGWKYIWHIQGKDELYDLNRDPMEMLNRLDEEPGRVAALRAEMFEWVTANLGKRPDAMALQLARIEAVRGKPVPYL